MLLTDILSNTPSRGANNVNQLNLHVHKVGFNDCRIQGIQVLSTAYRLIVNEWPACCTNIPKIICGYWDMSDELGIENGLLIKGEKIVIPTVLCDQFLADLHEGHV